MTQGTETTGRMKQAPDHEDEILDVRRHQDPGRNRLTPVVKLPPEVALAVVESLAGLVRAAHRGEEASPTPADALKQAQEFEEGDVFMLEPPSRASSPTAISWTSTTPPNATSARACTCTPGCGSYG